MASGLSSQTPLGMRHRIREINLHPTPSSRPVELEVLIDDKLIYVLPTVESGQPLHWDMRLLPCDVFPNSRVTLRFTKKNRISSDRLSLAEYIVSDVDGQSSVTIDVSTQFSRPPLSLTPHTKLARESDRKDPPSVTLKFWDRREIEGAYIAALTRSKLALDVQQGSLEGLGKASLVLEKVIGLGEALAELNPSAKIVTILFTAAWEHIEEIQRNHQDIQKLVNGLGRIMPFLESVREHSKEARLQGTVTSLLNLIEDVSNFITGYMTHSVVGRTLRNPLGGKADEQLTSLLQRFKDLKEDFDRGVQAEQLKHIVTNEQRSLLSRLSPAMRAHYSTKPACQQGTRQQVLNDVYEWISQLDTPKKLAWLYGHAGLGKSCISASVCHKLDEERKLGAHFFCKRDDPDLRRCGTVLNTIVHQLATRFGPYGKEVASAIDECPQLPESSLEQRYTRLIERPLRKLNEEQVAPTTHLAIVIDAFDECERSRERRLLLTFLRQMSGLVSWLKVMVTSRLDQDIKAALGRVDDPAVCSRDILVYDASYDIYACTQKRMLEIAEFKAQVDWSEQTIRTLSERSGGLFIWIETACKFIENGSDADSRLEQILDGTQPAEGSEPLDMLFTTAIEQSLGDGARDNVRNARLCLGAILATADRTPLSVIGLEGLMSSQMKRGVFRNVVSGLGSVLYEDKSSGNAVRVYHPSFADFISNRTRSNQFYVEPEEQNIRMAECCLRTMTKELAFNICGLETSHIANRDIPELEARVQTSISEQLRYSCLHWSSHVTAMPKGALKELLGEFILGRTLLYWMEALSLMSKLDVVLSSLLELVEWCSGTTQNISSYAHDAYRFVLSFYDAILESTPHLYLSALALAPNGSQIAQHMRAFFPNTLSIGGSLNGGWSTWLRNIPHGAVVTGTEISSDGRRIVSGTKSSLVQLWDADSGAAISDPLVGHTNTVRSVSFSSDGRRVVSSSYDHTARVWDLETGGTVSVLPHTAGIRIWDANVGNEVREPLEGHSDAVNSLAVTRNGLCIASGSSDHTVRLWELARNSAISEPLAAHTDYVYSVSFSPNDRQLVSGSNDGTIHIWDTVTRTILMKIPDRKFGPVWSARYSPSGRHIIAGTWDKMIRIWDVKTGALLSEPLAGHVGAVRSVVFSPNGRRVISGSEDGTVRVWDAEIEATPPEDGKQGLTSVWAVAFSPDSRKVASSHIDSVIRVWSVETGAVLQKIALEQEGEARSVQFSPDGRFVSYSCNHAVHICDAESGNAVSGPMVSHSDLIWSIAFSPDSKRIVSGSRDETIQVWDVESAVVLLGGNDSIIKIWDAESGDLVWEQLVGHSRPITSITIAPDSKQIVSGSQDNTIIVWDVETGTATSKPLMGNCGVVFSVAFSPDGERVVVGPYDNTVQVWDMKTHQRISEPFQGHTDFVKSVAWSPDGQYFASGSNDGTIRIWNADSSAVSNRTAVLRSELPKLPTLLRDLARLADKDGWVRMSSGELLIWLPAEYRIVDDSLLQFSELEVPDRLRVDTLKFEHDVNLRPTPSSRPVEFELLVDDKLIYSLPTVESGQPLHWDMRLLPIDVYANSRVTLKFTKKNRISSDRVSFVEYIVSDIDGQSSITIDVSTQGSRSPLSLTPHTKLARDSDKKEPGAVSLKFWGKKEVEDAYMAGLARAKLTLDAERGPLERLGKAGLIWRRLLNLLNPSAKSSLGYSLLLGRMMPFLDAIRQHSRGTQLKGPTTGLLNLIEDVANFITRYMSDTSPGKALRNPLSGKADEQIALLLRKFNELKEDFDRGVQIEQLKHIITNEGTREQVLKDVYDWISRLDTTKKLAWLYGHAGLGKSCISSSVCRKFDQEGKLAAHFFCKRDDPELRRPGCVLNTIVHQLATRFAPYGKEVANAIEECPQLPDSSLEQRYTRFIDRPLRNLNKEQISPSTSLAIVIDAFDECERTRDRRLLLTYLREMSGLVSWLKVMITSRIDQDIKLALGRAEDPVVCSRDVLVYDASYDIYACTQKRMLEIAEFKAQVDWSEQTIRMLSERSGGLFIWIETACKFIENGSDADSRLEQILDGTQPAEGSEPLDMLFATAIEQSLGDNAQDNMKRGVFRNVVNGLGSVLYEDKTAGNAVRVYHPSFADFLTNKSRSQRFHVEPEEQDTRMAECCLRTMTKELAFNISKVQLPTLDQPHYQNTKGALRELLSEFMLGQTLLYWMEALSVMSKLDVGLSSLLELVEWCSIPLAFYDAISRSTPHLYLSALALAPNGSQIAARMRPLFPNTLKIGEDLNAEWSPWLRTIPHGAVITSLEVSSDGRRIVSGAKNSLVQLWDADSGALISDPLLGHTDTVRSVSFSPDGRCIVSASYDHTARVWDLETGSPVSVMLHAAGVICAIFSPDSKQVFTGCFDEKIRLWDATMGTEAVEPLVGHSGAVNSLAVTRDGRSLASGSTDRTIRLWDLVYSSAISEPLVGHTDFVYSVAFSPDDHRLVSGSNDGTIRIWDITTRTVILSLLDAKFGPVWSAVYSPSGRHIISGTWDKAIRIWDAKTGVLLTEPLQGHLGAVRSAVFTSNGRRIISGSEDGTVRVWDAEIEVAPEPQTQDPIRVWAVAFSPDSRLVASSHIDSIVRIWDIETQAVLQEIKLEPGDQVWSVQFSPNGRLVSCSCNNAIKFGIRKTTPRYRMR
ncbi:WD40 repeat protein [Ceratobasidium sp. AG-Ba]|nr:WD40 repeat protein [Ceratobasidium sp. AG-Ba]